jgi:putative ABC transport system permease protein
MNTSEAIRIAMQSLWANKLRSFLTLLGMVIGIASVIAVITFVAGINGYVAEKIFNLGADVFITTKMPNVITDAEQFIEGQKRKDLTLDDYHAVVEECDACKVVGAAVNTFNGKVKYEEQSTQDVAIRGWSPSMARIYDLDLIAGRGLNEIDLRNSSQVAIIGHDILDNLLRDVDPIG